ncbi:hypothetical protein JXA02_03265, partial [candidate division KSB1 bacterium]
MKKIILFTFLFLCAGRVVPQINTLDREYVPVTAATDVEPLFGLNVNEWTAFRFDRRTASWRAIPFQFDELTDTKRYDRDKDGVTDATDEVTFMPTDTGDKAELWHWIDDPSARSERLELQVTDPLDASKKGWIYLYKNVTHSDELPSYLDFAPGPAGMPAADTIKTTAFKLGHNQNGWIDYMQFAGSGKDIVDRFKLRLKGNGFLTPAYDINEDWVEASTEADAVSYYPGPVRSFHITKAAILLEKLKIPLIPKRSSFEYNYEYTPYSFEIEAQTQIDASLLALFGVKLMRQSLDFNPDAVGMKFYSTSNPEGITIDGVVTPYSDVLNQNDQKNWVLASGNDGAAFLIFDITLMKNSRRRVYFHDQKENSSGDGTASTGDQYSYGDMGVMIEATGDALITNQLTIAFKGYFIDRANADVEYGKQLMEWELNPLIITAARQTYEPGSLVSSRSAPDDFQLHAAFPNPYSIASENGVRLEFSGRVNELYDLVVYNVIGQQVA